MAWYCCAVEFLALLGGEQPDMSRAELEGVLTTLASPFREVELIGRVARFRLPVHQLSLLPMRLSLSRKVLVLSGHRTQ